MIGKGYAETDEKGVARVECTGVTGNCGGYQLSCIASTVSTQELKLIN